MAIRLAQKNRTRAALLAAARQLLAEGEKVTVARVADEADISRATAYRYFSDAGDLATEAMLDIEIRPTHEILDGLTDVRARVHAVAGYYLRFAYDHEAQFRQFIAQTMRQWLEGGTLELRGARRIAAFAEALAPVADRLPASEFDDLVQRLSMLTGAEQLIGLSDVLKVSRAEGERLQAGLVDALLDSALPAE